MHWPSISVIITSLNRASFIQRALLSILRQDYRGKVEVIVADGGSSDGTVEILRRYPQVTWWSQKDNGIVDAINLGLSRATGEFVAIQDSDNYYLRDAFRLTLACAREFAEYEIISGCDVYLEADGSSFVCSKLDDHEITPRSLLMRRVIPIHCACVRREIIDKVGGFRDFSGMHQEQGGNVGNVGIDIDFWYRALHFHRARFVPHHTAVYQRHPNQMSVNSSQWYANLTGMVQRCESDGVFGARFRLYDEDKRNLFIRWEIQQEKLNGNDERVRELVDRVMNDQAFTDETRQYLGLHGFVPRTPDAEPRGRHANHKVPEFHWYNEPLRRSEAA